MDDTDSTLPDFGALMNSQEPKSNPGNDVIVPDNLIKSFLYGSAPYVECENVTIEVHELEANIPDLEALTSSVLPNACEKKQSLASRNCGSDYLASATGALSTDGEEARRSVIPLTVEDMVASELSVKSEYDSWQYGSDSWPPATHAQFSCENQSARRWSSTSYPFANETYGKRGCVFHNYGCAPDEAQLFTQIGASDDIHGNSYTTAVQFAGKQQAAVNMYGKRCTTRTMDMRHDLKCRSYTSLSDGRPRTFQEEDDLTRTSDEMSDDVCVTGQLARRRMSNKTAAMKSRQRKRERAQILKKEWLDTECDNTRMRYEICQLRKQVASLQGILRDHECKRLSPEFTLLPSVQSVSGT